MKAVRRRARRDAALRARITGAWPLVTGTFQVRAGSALVGLGARLFVIQDDAWQAWWVSPRTRKLVPLVLRGGGHPLAKKKKPDFEAAFALGRDVWILGSGGKPKRRRLARVTPGPEPRVQVIEARALYAALQAALGMPPNIEGAVPRGERLQLFHRGPGAAREASAVLEVPMAVLDGARPEVLSLQPWDLGRLASLNLGFTDAVALDPRRALYLAVAEDTPDGIVDGPVAGAAVGVIEGRTARWTRLLEDDGSPSRRKVEGVALDDDRKGGWLVTDPDDAKLPAQLCRLELEGF